MLDLPLCHTVPVERQVRPTGPAARADSICHLQSNLANLSGVHRAKSRLTGPAPSFRTRLRARACLDHLEAHAALCRRALEASSRPSGSATVKCQRAMPHRPARSCARDPLQPLAPADATTVPGIPGKAGYSLRNMPALTIAARSLTFRSKTTGACDEDHSEGSGRDSVEIREKAGLLPGAEVDFELDGEGVRIVRARAPRGETRGQRAVRLLRGSATVRMTTDEIMALTRGEE